MTTLKHTHYLIDMETLLLRVVMQCLGIFGNWRISAALILSIYCGFANANNSVALTNVIAHPNVDVSELTRSQLRQIFTGHQQYWEDGSKIRVVVLNSTDPIHQSFCKTSLSMFPYQLERLWNQLTYSGQGEPPIRVSSLEEMHNAVSSTPGSIGYTSSDHPSQTQVLEMERR